MKQIAKIAAAAMMTATSLWGAEVSLNGAGATFPAPVYRVWTYNFTQENPQIEVTYQGSGSGAGINQIKEKTIDFGGTDNPLTKEELDKANLAQFPMLTGGVVIVVNLPGIEANQLKLDQDTVGNIFLGNITNWSDPKIAAVNPGVKLPNLKITVVRRGDSSGTTFIFTNYLAKISKEWSDKIGCGPAVNWPSKGNIAGQKNPGVCSNVIRIPGAIGYTEYTYAVESKLATVALKNHDGKFVEPNMDTFKASSANADWQNAPGFYMVLTDQPGETSWPITGLTYVLVQRNQPNAAKAAALKKYFDWCYTTGAPAAVKLQYVPVPENVVKLIDAEWKNLVQVK